LSLRNSLQEFDELNLSMQAWLLLVFVPGAVAVVAAAVVLMHTQDTPEHGLAGPAGSYTYDV
jgi:sugar phosphate permease